MAEAQNNKQQNQEQDLNQILKARREKLANLQAAGKDPFVITKYDQTHHSQEIKDNFETLEGQTVSIAGRIMFKRVMGKASFCNVQDLQGNIQSYVARDSIGEETYADFLDEYLRKIQSDYDELRELKQIAPPVCVHVKNKTHALWKEKQGMRGHNKPLQFSKEKGFMEFMEKGRK